MYVLNHGCGLLGFYMVLDYNIPTFMYEGLYTPFVQILYFFQRDVFYNGGVYQDQNQKIQSEAPETKII